jgi:hypothetical protein
VPDLFYVYQGIYQGRVDICSDYFQSSKSEVRMNKVKALMVVNPLLLCLFIIQVITSLIIFFQIKIPSVQLVAEIHEYNGLLLILVAAMHITLNWGWIQANFFKKR